MNPHKIKALSAAVPRYTSYPTAPHFSPDVDAESYETWLKTLPVDEPLSIYMHIPFCDSLCWYCGCNTKMVKRYDPVSSYVDVLIDEVISVSSCATFDHDVSHVHWGGGSPSILAPNDMMRLSLTTRACFNWRDDVEFAVEIDPRYIDDGRINAFVDAGVTRVSFGVQDFNPKVQAAINRAQSFVETKAVVDRFRQAGIQSINIDLVYGLPHQTRDSVAQTIDQVLTLSPDRIALFGYAHLPARLAHQRLIEDAALPGPIERLAQSKRAASDIIKHGYVRVGLDHFAKPTDTLATRPVKRNFQGYSSDDAKSLIGFGASAIGQFAQGYVQNAVPVAEYTRRVRERGLATARGVVLSQEDRARALVINRLMCELSFPSKELRSQFGDIADVLIKEADQ
ncbi:MAG: oxygen-independent coproporphyrinogen III oxidase, partial [Hyphomicrobiaceae bacterium]